MRNIIYNMLLGFYRQNKKIDFVWNWRLNFFFRWVKKKIPKKWGLFANKNNNNNSNKNNNNIVTVVSRQMVATSSGLTAWLWLQRPARQMAVPMCPTVDKQKFAIHDRYKHLRICGGVLFEKYDKKRPHDRRPITSTALVTIYNIQTVTNVIINYNINTIILSYRPCERAYNKCTPRAIGRPRSNNVYRDKLVVFFVLRARLRRLLCSTSCINNNNHTISSTDRHRKYTTRKRSCWTQHFVAATARCVIIITIIIYTYYNIVINNNTLMYRCAQNDRYPNASLWRFVKRCSTTGFLGWRSVFERVARFAAARAVPKFKGTRSTEAYFTGRRRRRRRLLSEWVGGAVPSRTRRRRPYSSRRVPLPPPPSPHQRAPPNRTQWRTLACGRETGSLWSWTAYARPVSSGKCRSSYETWSHRVPAVLLPRDIGNVRYFFEFRCRSLF